MNTRTRLIIAIDIPDKNIPMLEEDFHKLVNSQFIDSFYFLTASSMNGSNTVAEAIQHKDQHLAAENRLANSIAAIQNGAFTVIND
jgi:hypothetical protein